MTDGLRPDEAARALAEIEQRQQQVVELTIIPGWYWWAVAGLEVGLAAGIESRQPLALGLGVGGFVVGLLAATGLVVFHALRRAQPRHNLVSDLLGPVGILTILGFVAAVLAVSLPTGFALKAAGAAYPATWGTLAGAVVLAVGGPLLMRHLRRVMLTNRAGSHR